MQVDLQRLMRQLTATPANQSRSNQQTNRVMFALTSFVAGALGALCLSLPLTAHAADGFLYRSVSVINGLSPGGSAPKGTPTNVIQKINADVNRALKSPEVAKAYNHQGVIVDGGTSQEFARLIADDIARSRSVVQGLNLQ
jgi:hypothetical protein